MLHQRPHLLVNEPVVDFTPRTARVLAQQHAIFGCSGIQPPRVIFINDERRSHSSTDVEGERGELILAAPRLRFKQAIFSTDVKKSICSTYHDALPAATERSVQLTLG